MILTSPSAVRWNPIQRPGYLGRRRDQIHATWNEKYGPGNWGLRWFLAKEGKHEGATFMMACQWYYEYSYVKYFREHPEELDYICRFGECIDNAHTNIQSGCDYSKQEAFSTHIQDIAIRNVLRINKRKFEGAPDNILVIRSSDSNGYKYGPGNIPFFAPKLIIEPQICPSWAFHGSVEAFWQSNKYLCLKEIVEWK
jgi:hypothetical protein